MPKLAIGTPVALKPDVRDGLCFPCGASADLFVAVHPGALKAPQATLTVVVERVGNEIVWVGALDESMLDERQAATWPAARQALCDRITLGAHLWVIHYPGALLKSGVQGGMVYQGKRPWLVIGELSNGVPLAVPLNSTKALVTNKPYNIFLDKTWYVIRPSDTDMRRLPSDTNSTAELPHIWSLPTGLPDCGEVLTAHIGSAVKCLNIYYPSSNGPRA
ncbi:MAG: hypothetical protein IPP83_09785 [Flavobacteriales bacterium]|nr:hypothetical protein [Flavobacteriales bacterium]